MEIYIELLVVALTIDYIVDISGFTEAWRSLVATKLGVKNLKPLPPFDCGKCMSWWMCLLWALCTGHFTLWSVGFSALLSNLSVPLGQLIIFIRESLTWLLNKVMPR